jgi:hypothetical protein
LKSKVSAEAHLIEAFPGPTKGRSSAGPIGLPLPPPVAVCPPSPLELMPLHAASCRAPPQPPPVSVSPNTLRSLFRYVCRALASGGKANEPI